MGVIVEVSDVLPFTGNRLKPTIADMSDTADVIDSVKEAWSDSEVGSILIIYATPERTKICTKYNKQPGTTTLEMVGWLEAAKQDLLASIEIG